MIKNVYIRVIFYSLLAIVCLYNGSAWAQSDGMQHKIKIGKENPFTELPKKNKESLISPQISGFSDEEDIPELFVKAVTLKSLNVKSLKTAIENLLSKYGRISVDEETNSLIICDTEKRLERILAQIRNADEAAIPQQVATPKETETIPELVAESITPKFLDAKDLKAAIEKMCSQYGSISTIEKSNSLIICDTQKNLEMILAEIRKIDKPTPGLLVETVTLKFLEAKNLKKAIDSMSSQYGSIATNDSTNSLVICDTKDKLEEILAEIRKADQTPEQIMIEVVIVDVQLEDDTEIGVNWDRIFESKRDWSYSQTLIPTTLTTGAKFSVIKSDISSTIRALQETRNVEILASPRVLVVSGQKAFIKTIEEIPYEEITDTSEGGANALTSTEFKEVGITLDVKATLTDQQKILITIKPEQSVKTGESVGDVPIVDTRGVETSLIMEDGQVAVIGGLRRKETRLTENKVPLLGDLPLFGRLFSNNKEETNLSELIVLISPHIYKGQPIPEDVMKKFNELKDKPMLSSPKYDNISKENNTKDELLAALTLLEEKISRQSYTSD